MSVGNQIFKKCPFCGYEWKSRKMEPKECPLCKRRLDFFFRETKACQKFCEELDAKIRSGVEVAADYTELGRSYGFRPTDLGGIEFTKISSEGETKQTVKSTYEILKTWDWRGFSSKIKEK